MSEQIGKDQATTPAEVDQRVAPGITPTAHNEEGSAADQASDPSSASRRKWIALIAALVVLCLAGAGVVFAMVPGSGDTCRLPVENSANQENSENVAAGNSANAATVNADSADAADNAAGNTNAASNANAESNANETSEASQKDASADQASDEVSRMKTSSDQTDSAAASDGGSAASSNEGGSATDANMLTVSVYVDSSRAPGYGACMANEQVQVPAGSSVYDALLATGLSIGGSSSYVSSISGLAEKFPGHALSGWMYSVDGDFPNVSCGGYSLQGGESIVWVYTLDAGNDL